MQVGRFEWSATWYARAKQAVSVSIERSNLSGQDLSKIRQRAGYEECRCQQQSDGDE
jgi:hypothetical protein